MKYVDMIPKPLLQDIVKGYCFPVIGAGFSKNAKFPNGKIMPSWDELGKILVQNIPNYHYETATDAVSCFENEFGRPALIEKLRDLLLVSSSQPGATHIAFCQIPFTIVCTTNFDSLLEKGYEVAKRHYHVVVNEKDLSVHPPEDATILLKLHGDLNQPDSLVVTEDDYDDFLTKKPMTITVLTNHLVRNTPLFIGYSARDYDFRLVWRLVKKQLEKLTRSAYVITAGAKDDDIKRFKRRNIQVINLDIDSDSYPEVLEEFFVELGHYFLKPKMERSAYSAVSLLSEEKGLRFEYKTRFNPIVFKITVVWAAEEISGMFEHSYFFEGELNKARKKAIEAFEKDMTDMPIDWEGYHASLKKLKITRYSQISNGTKPGVSNMETVVCKVVITAKVGSKENYFEVTFADFGEDTETVEKDLYDKLRGGTQRIKSVPRKILERHTYIAEYSKVTSWEEDIDGKVLFLSKTTIPKEEQKEKIRSFFLKEFNLDVEDFLSLDEIDSDGKYFENFEAIKKHLCDMFKEDPNAFRSRMTDDNYRKLESLLVANEF